MEAPAETVVANIHRDGELIAQAKAEGRYVYIGRPSAGRPWGFGNPFSYKNDTKAMVIVDNPIKAFRLWLLGDAYTALMQEERRWILKQLPSLKGYVLGCFCAPSKCHGDVLKEMIDTMPEQPTGPVATKPQIRGLTLWQPWAWHVVRPDVLNVYEREELERKGLIKLVENRSWSPPDALVGHYLAIHAGRQYEEIPDDFYRERGIDVRPPVKEALTYGAIIGVCIIQSYYDDAAPIAPQQRPWFFGPYGWVLSRPVPIEPVPCRGFQGLWRLPGDVLAEVRRRYREQLDRWTYAARSGGEGKIE